MITLRRADARGRTRLSWLDSRHSFSFGEYYDPRLTGFGPLLVINEDRVAPGAGFPTHGHRDMEIISYVLEGALEHKDSIGNGAVIRPGDVQRMSAGTGIRHSEFNPSPEKPVHFLQIWVEPERTGIEPSYEQKAFAAEERQGRLRLVASHDGREGSVTLHSPVDLYAALLVPDDRISLTLANGRGAWVQVSSGAVLVNGERLGRGDGAALSAETELVIDGKEAGEVLLFDLPLDARRG
jgi:redox-sensitive bicupin YhaK (pirin superfamily)